MTNQTRIVARAIIQKNGQILLCQIKGDKHWFFPGGGVEFQEGAEETLRREMVEEIGATVLSTKFIGVCENPFTINDKATHELNLVFSVEIDDVKAVAKEDHMHFDWFPLSALLTENILPKHLVAGVVQWMKDGKMFWAGME